MDVVELARELVRIPSVNPMGRCLIGPEFGEAAMAEKVSAVLAGLGARANSEMVLPGRPNVTGFFDFGAPDTILFEAHLDTVPTDNMAVPPFDGLIENDRLYGRGSVDVKGPMAAMLCAIDAVRSMPLTHNIFCAAVCDEEYRFSGVRRLLETMNPTLRSSIRFAIVAEPTDLVPVAGHKGGMRWKIFAHGIAAHSSVPEAGKNAIYSAAESIVRLRDYAGRLRARPPHAKLGSPSLSVGVISGGSAANIVPDYCEIDVDRRLVPGETPEQAMGELIRELDGCDVTVDPPYMSVSPLEQAETSPAVQAAAKASCAVGVDARIEYAQYCTNASFYQEAGIPVVVFGPGCIAQAHTKDEFIRLNALTKGVDAYMNILSAG